MPETNLTTDVILCALACFLSGCVLAMRWMNTEWRGDVVTAKLVVLLCGIALGAIGVYNMVKVILALRAGTGGE